jgi:prepilin-type N-terminal cleavage/methylation domain-containing protein
MREAARRQRGFTLLELMVATAIFMVICAAMFELLDVSQKKYAIETQMSGTFGEARLGLDQIVRDINVSGYPPANLFSNTVNPLNFAQTSFPWSPGGYPNGTCQIEAGCTVPGDFALVLEGAVQNHPGISWTCYELNQLQNDNVLYYGVVQKTSGDAWAACQGAGVLTPLVGNVMNDTNAGQIAQITAQYPSLFPGGQVQPLFVYTCSTPNGTQLCTSAGSYNQPQNITDVDITLIVESPEADLQTGAVKLVELTARGHRTNVE